MIETAEQLKPVQNHEINREARIRTDTATWLAETLHGSMRTAFEFSFDGQELYADDNGTLSEVFDDSIETAREITRYNPSLLFELRRRLIEKEEYEDMIKMANGELPNTMIVVSDFPPELMSAKEDLGGYNASRKQTMLRVITREEDGSIRIVTQSLDGSNRKALEDIYKAMGETAEEGELLEQRIHRDLPGEWQTKLTDILTDTYDESLGEQLGGDWHAGIRKPYDGEGINTYDFASAQNDLLDWFTGLKLSDPRNAEKERYKIAATANARWERFIKQSEQPQAYGPNKISIQIISGIVAGRGLFAEMARESQIAKSSGRTFSGCGASVSAENDLNSAESQLETSGYGNKTGSDKYGSLTFNCPKGHKNTRPRNELIEKCKTCGTSVKC